MNYGVEEKKRQNENIIIKIERGLVHGDRGFSQKRSKISGAL